jgi:DNA-binding CsgD family transcriptional regulator
VLGRGRGEGVAGRFVFGHDRYTINVGFGFLGDGRVIETCIGSIYDAALSPEHWDGAVQQIGVSFGAKVLLLHGGVQSFRGAQGWALDIDPRTWAEGSDEAYRPETNPALRIVLSAPLGAVLDRRQFVTDDGMDRHPLRTNFFHPNGIFHLLLSQVQQDTDSATLLFIARRRQDPAFDRRETRGMTVLAGHVGRAMRTHRALRLAEARGLAFAQALERLRHGVILADSGLRVLHANRAAEVMLDAGEGLARRFGRLTLGDPRAQAALEAAARRLAGPWPEPGEARIVLPRPGGRPPRAVTVLPALGDGPSAVATGARLLILVADPEGAAAPDPAALARAFGLTAAEARVAALAAGGTHVDIIAARLGVSANTVKAQLKAVYLKTGTGNRAELLRLALAAAT